VCSVGDKSYSTFRPKLYLLHQESARIIRKNTVQIIRERTLDEEERTALRRCKKVDKKDRKECTEDNRLKEGLP
jgi:hypothetical protein